MKRPIVLLSGFPSSGTLKVQKGLAHLMTGWVNSLPQLEALIPEIHLLDAPPESSADFPVNLLFTYKLPLSTLRAHGISKSIYVLRDPIDSAISIANWMMMSRLNFAEVTEGEMHQTRLALIDFYLRNGTPMEFVLEGYGTWNTHTLAWLRGDLGIPTMVVDFSQLKTHASSIISDMAAFIGAPCSDAIVKDVVHNWDIETPGAWRKR